MTPDSEKRPSEAARAALETMSAWAEYLRGDPEQDRNVILAALDAYDALAAQRSDAEAMLAKLENQPDLVEAIKSSAEKHRLAKRQAVEDHEIAAALPPEPKEE